MNESATKSEPDDFGHFSPDGKEYIITEPGMAGRRVAGKQFICTEFNERAPNTHSSEPFLLLSAYAALQDWDGVFAFAYSQAFDNWNAQHVCGYFDIDQDPEKMATLPAAVSMFVREDVSAAKRIVDIPVTWDAAIDASLRSGSWWGAPAFGADKLLPLQSRVQLDVSGPALGMAASNPISRGAHGQIVSVMGELTWDTEKGRVTVNTAQSKAFIGKITGDTVTLSDVSIEPQKNDQNWAVITTTSASSQDGTANPRSMLITATGYEENTGMPWTSAEKNSVGVDWGNAPSHVEGISAKITLPARFSNAKAWALDGMGQRKSPVNVVRTDGGVVIEIGLQYQTIWYEVEIPDKAAVHSKSTNDPL